MKNGTFTYQMQVPVKVIYSVDDRISVDAVSVPDEDEIYKLVDKNAPAIKQALETFLEGEI